MKLSDSLLLSIVAFLCVFVYVSAHGQKRTFLNNPLTPSSSQGDDSTLTQTSLSTISRKLSIQTKLHHYYGGEKSSSKVREVSDVSELNGILSAAEKKKQLVVLDFTASWCGPCKFISPYFHELAESKEFSKVIFVKVDVDEASDIAGKYQVSAMPTFLFLKDRKVVDRFSGASKEKLLQVLRQHS